MRSDRELNSEAAITAISVVTSEEIVNSIGGAARLSRLQDKISNVKEDVVFVKEVLQTIEEEDVSPELVKEVDNILESSAKELMDEETPRVLKSVGGMEDFNLTLTPGMFLKSRIEGCESLISSISKMSTVLSTKVTRFFKETYYQITTSRESLLSTLEELQDLLDGNKLDDKKKVDIELSTRLFNLLRVGNKVNLKTITQDLGKTTRMISAMHSFFVVESQKEIDNAMKYFGAFEKRNTDSIRKLYKEFPSMVPPINFREAKIKVKSPVDDNYVLRKTPSGMSGSHFLDFRLKDTPEIKTALDVLNYSKARYKEKLKFERDSEVVVPDKELTHQALTTSQIKDLLKIMFDVIDKWAKFDDQIKDRPTIVKEFNSLASSIWENENLEELDREVGILALESFIRSTIFERGFILMGVNKYLVSLFLGISTVCRESIKARKE